MKHMNPTQLFTQVKKFQTVEQLKEWAREIGFDFESNDKSENDTCSTRLMKDMEAIG